MNYGVLHLFVIIGLLSKLVEFKFIDLDVSPHDENQEEWDKFSSRSVADGEMSNPNYSARLM